VKISIQLAVRCCKANEKSWQQRKPAVARACCAGVSITMAHSGNQHAKLSSRFFRTAQVKR
jgi:hypothetical protein